MRRLCSVLASLLLVVVCFMDPTDAASADGCNQTDFETLWAKTHGTVKWAMKDMPGIPGVVKCTKGYIFNSTDDLVYCPPGSQTYALADPKGACIDDPFIDTKVVPFQGLTYNFTHIKVGSKTVNFPVLYPNTSYIITTQYTASKTTPTIRVRVGLVGKSHKPVLVNIQQSTESVGFELPMKVVGKGSKELAPLNDHTVELCPVTIKKDKDGKDIKTIETVQIILTGGGRQLTHKNAGDPYIQVHPSAVQHMELTPGKPMGPTNVDDRESLVYRYTWPVDDSIDKVDILVTHFEGDKGHLEGKGADVCAKVSVRSGTCPIEEMGIHVLTFTRQAFITVSKHDERLKDVKDGFLVVVDVFPDDWECTSDMDRPVNNGRTKSVQIQLTESPKTIPGVYLIFPIMTCVFLVILTGVVLFLFIRPLSNVKTLVDDDDELVDADDTRALVLADEPPPFDKQQEFMPKKVDLEEVEFGVPEEDSEANSDQEPGPSAQDSDELLNHLFNLGASAGPNVAGDGVLNFKGIWNKVKRNELVVNITQTIGHCSVPLLVFLNSFDSTYIDITGNLKEHTENGDLDACYVNSRCAYAGTISGYNIPDVSRVYSNLPYVMSGVCFWFLAVQKSKVMEQINRMGKGVKHDFAIFNALAFITAIIGIASAMYHVCPNQTTSRIDMYFIEILLGYYSLKLYQSRVPDIRAVYYAPAIIVCVLSAVERVLGGSQLSWDLLAGFHLSFTLWVSIQLFFLGKCSMNPWTMYKEWSSVSNKIKEAKGKPEFKFQAGFFAVGILATSIIAGSAIGGYWTEQTMYNVVALSTDIVIYIMYYVVTKCVLRKEKLRTHVVVIIAASFFTWAVSFIFFFFYKNINTSVSPAESRCLNRACLGGFIDGHDLWHCLSATAIFLTNVMILLMDDDLLDMKTEDTYF